MLFMFNQLRFLLWFRVFEDRTAVGSPGLTLEEQSTVFLLSFFYSLHVLHQPSLGVILTTPTAPY